MVFLGLVVSVFLNGENTLVSICATQLRHVAAKAVSANDSWLLNKELLYTHIQLRMFQYNHPVNCRHRYQSLL